jgi:hypothetical protein
LPKLIALPPPAWIWRMKTRERKKTRVTVGRVVAVIEPVPLQVGLHIRAARPDHRAEPRARQGGQDRQAARARPAQEAEQHGLGSVVGVVRGRDESGAHGRGGLLERLVAGLARPRHQVATRGQRDSRAAELDPLAICKRLGEIELGARFRPEPVVDAVGMNREFQSGRQPREHMQERLRVATARHADQQTSAGRQMALGLQGSLDELEQRRRVGPPSTRHASSNSLQNVTSSTSDSRTPRCGSTG